MTSHALGRQRSKGRPRRVSARMGEPGTPHTAGENAAQGSHRAPVRWRLHTSESPRDLTPLLLGTESREGKAYVHVKTCTAPLFSTVRSGKSPDAHRHTAEHCRPRGRARHERPHIIRPHSQEMLRTGDSRGGGREQWPLSLEVPLGTMQIFCDQRRWLYSFVNTLKTTGRTL